MSSICGDVMMSEVGEDSAVNKSYTRLEDVVRNFSRELNVYEENISLLSRRLELAEEELGSKDEALKVLTVERDRLKQIHDDDGKARFAVDALMTSYEHKVQILEKALTSFDMSTQDFMSRSDALDEFNQQIKSVQLELHRKWKEQQIKNEEVLKLYQQKVVDIGLKLDKMTEERGKYKEEGDMTKNELQDLKMEYTKFSQEKFQIETELNRRLLLAEEEQAKNKESLETYHQRVSDIGQKLDEMTEERDKLKEEKNITNDELQGLKMEYTKFSQEKFQIETELNRRLLLAEEEQAKNMESLETYRQNVADIGRKLEEMTDERDKIKKEGDISNTELQDLKKEYTKFSQEKFQIEAELNRRLLLAEEDQAKNKESLETYRQSVADIGQKLEEMTEERDKLKEDGNITKNELQDLKTEYTKFSQEKLQIETELNRRLLLAEEEEVKNKESLETYCHNVADIGRKLEEMTEERDKIKEEVDAARNELQDFKAEHTKCLREKHDIESQLLVQMRTNKEKDAEFQDSANHSAKQIQLLRAGYDDLNILLEAMKNEKLALTESYSKLSDDKKQTELSLNEELSSKTDKIKILLEEIESLRLVQKRYTDLKRHLSSLMKEKSNSQSNSKSASCKTNDNDVIKTQEKDVNRTSPTYVSALSQDEQVKDKRVEPRPSFQRSQPVTPSRRPGSILKSPVEPSEKKNVSFCSPLTFCVGLTSSSDSSSETENSKDSQKALSQKRLIGSKSKDSALAITPQKRTMDKLPQKKAEGSPEKKAKLSENDAPEARKFFRKKAIKCPPPAYKITQK